MLRMICQDYRWGLEPYDTVSPLAGGGHVTADTEASTVGFCYLPTNPVLNDANKIFLLLYTINNDLFIFHSVHSENIYKNVTLSSSSSR